jgi:hypothetical protein
MGLGGLSLGRAACEQSNNRKIANEMFFHKKAFLYPRRTGFGQARNIFTAVAKT